MIPPTIPPENSPHDCQIDDLLQALGTHATPAGMEQRLLRTLAEQQEHLPAQSLWSRLSLWPKMLPGMRYATRRTAQLRPVTLLAFATAMAIAILVFPSHHPHRSTPPAKASQVLNVQPLNPPASIVATPAHAAYAAYAPPTVPRHRPTTIAAVPAEQASFPAPPMPLTEEELQLQRIAQRRDPEQIAALDPRFQERLDARDSDEFKRFFTPPTPPPTYPDATPPQPAPTGDPR